MELVVEPHVVRQESGYQSVSWLDTAAAIGMSRLTSKGVNVRNWSIFKVRSRGKEQDSEKP